MATRDEDGVKRVVLVDDHALVRAGLVDLINAESDLAVCGEAQDSGTALRLIEQEKPDLIVLDLMLRGGSGLELIKQVIAMQPDARILVCSMHDEALFAERVFAAGAMGYVSKQEPSRIVREAIRRVLVGRIHASEDVTDRLLRRVGGRTQDNDVLPVDQLSDRELEVLELLGEGMKTREIADHLNLSTKTIDTHREHIKDKLGLKNANELLRFAVVWTLDPARVPPVESDREDQAERDTP